MPGEFLETYVLINKGGKIERFQEFYDTAAIVDSPDEVITQTRRAFAEDAKQWREWSTNISKLSQPRASLDIAEFLLSI